VELLGIERLGGKVSNDEVGVQLKEVISNETTIEEIKNWVNAYAVEEDHKRAEELAKAKQETEPSKKARGVPDIYAIAKPDETKKAKPDKQEKSRKEPEKEGKEKTK